MNKLISALFLVAALLSPFEAKAANPSFKSFDTNQFVVSSDLIISLSTNLVGNTYNYTTIITTNLFATYESVTNLYVTYLVVSNIVSGNIQGTVGTLPVFGPDSFSLQDSIVTQNNTNSITVNGFGNGYVELSNGTTTATYAVDDNGDGVLSSDETGIIVPNLFHGSEAWSYWGGSDPDYIQDLGVASYLGGYHGGVSQNWTYGYSPNSGNQSGGWEFDSYFPGGNTNNLRVSLQFGMNPFVTGTHIYNDLMEFTPGGFDHNIQVNSRSVFHTSFSTNANNGGNTIFALQPYAPMTYGYVFSYYNLTNNNTDLSEEYLLLVTNSIPVIQIGMDRHHFPGDYSKLWIYAQGTNGTGGNVFDSLSAGEGGSPNPFKFNFNGTSAAAFDTTGALLIGKTAPSGWLGFTPNYSLVSISDKDAGESGINTVEQEAYHAGSSSTDRYSSFVTTLASASNTNLVTAGVTMLARSGVVGAIRDYNIGLAMQNGTASTNTAWGVGPYLAFGTTRTGGGSTNYMSLWPSIPNTNAFSSAGIQSPYSFDTENSVSRLPHHTVWKNHGSLIASISPDSGYTGAGTLFLSDDGTYKSAGGGGGSQTPWLSDINAAGFSLVWGPGATNKLYRNDNLLELDSTSGTFLSFNTDASKSSSMSVTADVGSFLTTADDVQLGNSLEVLDVTATELTVSGINVANIGSPLTPFKDEFVQGTIYVQGFQPNLDDYSRLAVSHTGTNSSTGKIIFDSQAAGTAGPARNFYWMSNSVEVAELTTGAFGASKFKLTGTGVDFGISIGATGGTEALISGEGGATAVGIRDKSSSGKTVVWTAGIWAPETFAGSKLGSDTLPWQKVYLGPLTSGSDGTFIQAGNGSPEGAVSANVGSMWLRLDGGAGTTMYVKESGVGNTGWIAK